MSGIDKITSGIQNKATLFFSFPLAVFVIIVSYTGLFFPDIYTNETAGMLFAPVVLTFAVLMDITIGLMVIVLNIEGIETDLSGVVIMILLALFTLVLLIWFLKSIQLTKIET